jgi:hypothetical protein
MAGAEGVTGVTGVTNVTDVTEDTAIYCRQMLGASKRLIA